MKVVGRASEETLTTNLPFFSTLIDIQLDLILETGRIVKPESHVHARWKSPARRRFFTAVDAVCKKARRLRRFIFEPRIIRIKSGFHPFKSVLK
jgi:hypothetical protein